MTTMMMALFVFLVVGSFLLFNISAFEMTEDLIQSASSGKDDIQSLINEALNKRKRGPLKGFQQLITETQTILTITGRENMFSKLCAVSMVLLVVGATFGFLIQNGFLSLVLGFGLALIPFWYIKLSEHTFQKELNEELETSLSVITTTYTRNENIIKAVEENIYHIKPPVADVFQSFLNDTKYISASTSDALLRMSTKINNSVFKEWCYALIACQDNRNLKNTLSPIVKKLSDVRVVTGDLSIALYDPLREMLIISGLVVGFPLLIYFVNIEWFRILVDTYLGKGVLAIDWLLAFIAVNAGIRLTKPIEYKR